MHKNKDAPPKNIHPQCVQKRYFISNAPQTHPSKMVKVKNE